MIIEKRYIRQKCPLCGQTVNPVNKFEISQFWDDYEVEITLKKDGGFALLCRDCMSKVIDKAVNVIHENLEIKQNNEG